MVVMALCERIISLEVQKAYEELKAALLRRGCKIVTEEPTKSIIVEQGSLWGMSPKGVKKRVTFSLFPYDSKTRVVSVTSLASDWVATSVFGCILSLLLAFVFYWIATDMEAFIAAKRHSLWGWLAEAFGYSGFQEALAIVGLIKILSIVLLVIAIVSILTDLYIYAKKDSFSEEVVKLLP